MRWLVIGFMALLMLAGSATAQIADRGPLNPWQCGIYSFYTAADAATGNIAAAIAQDKDRFAMRSCNDDGGHTHFFLRVLTEQRSGICRATETEVYSGNDSDVAELAPDVQLKGWRAEMPEDWHDRGYRQGKPVRLLFATQNACPVMDGRYIYPGEYTEDELKQIAAAIRAFTVSSDSFDAAFANAKLDPFGGDLSKIEGPQGDALRERQKAFREKYFSEFKARVLDPNAVVSPWYISCPPAKDDCSIFLSTWIGQGYASYYIGMRLTGANAEITFWSMPIAA